MRATSSRRPASRVAVTFTIEDHLRAAGRRCVAPRVAERAIQTLGQEAARGGPACRALHGEGRACHAAADAPQRRIAARSRGGRAVPGAARPAPGRFRSRSADRLQRAPDDLRGDGARAAARHHHRVCRSRVSATTSRRYFEDVDHAFTCSQFLTDVYREKVGLVSTPIEPPIDWSTVVAPVGVARVRDLRQPVASQGPAAVRAPRRHARIAGGRTFPILVVQSGHSGGSLNAIPGVDFSKYPQIMAAPPVPTPADYFALTRILVVPSVWEEPFGRVAAEAMINAIPPLVSNRGSLPHVVGGDFSEGGGGRVLPIPDWMTFKTTQLPERAGSRAVVRGRLCAVGRSRALSLGGERERVRSPKSGTAKACRARNMSTTSPR